MSKKNSKGSQQRATQEQVVQLANLKVAETVTVLLPLQMDTRQRNLPLLQAYLKAKINNKKITPGQHFVALFKGVETSFVITEVDGVVVPSQDHDISEETQELKPTQVSKVAFLASNSTQIKLINACPPQKDLLKEQEHFFYGYQLELDTLKQNIEYSLFKRQELIQNGLGPLKGILISGFSGVGKSALAQAVTQQLRRNYPEINWRSISSVEMLSRVVGGAEQFIRGVFAELRDKTPAVLVIEDLHLLFGAKQVSSHQTVLAALLSEMDKTHWERIVVLATYVSDRELAPSVKSAGKFEKEIEMPLPNHSIRMDILQKMVGRLGLQHEIDYQGLRKINLRLNGFTVGEIKQILREAYSNHGTGLNAQHLEEMLKRYRPAEIKELIVEVPEVYWNQIGGYESVKREIRKVVELPLQHAAKFAKFGIEPSKGILLYGPPGCSKTMMAKAIATESKLNFIGIKGPQLFSKYVGESERAIRNIFKRARACSPCVIFFDEIDAIATQRSGNTEVSERVLCQLLNEMDGIEGLKEVAIVAATNRPEILDKALMRPGRFDYLIYVSPPDEKAREEIFRIYLQKSVKSEKVQELSELMAKKTENYTGAEISLICRQAVMLTLEEDLESECIGVEQLQGALKKVKKRLTWDLIAKYQQFSSSLKE